MEEAPVRLVWELIERGDPEKLCSFRMTNIPLPAGAPPPPRRPTAAPPPQRPAAARKPNQPFYQEVGGALVTQVLIDGKPAPPGRLALGLAAKQGSAWGPIRWIEVEVPTEGRARLEDLQPGSYRLLRAYRPQPNTAVPNLAEGRWDGGETTVEITAGKETVVPPFRWLRDPPQKAGGAPAHPRRKPGARPAPAPRRPRPGGD